MNIAAIQQIIAHSAQADDPITEDYWAGLNNDAPYYKFLYFLARAVQPKLVVELGVLHGKGTAYLAAGAPEAQVIGIDFNHPGIALPYANIQFRVGNTLRFGRGVVTNMGLLIDLLFIDSTHEAAHATKEFDLYWPMVRPGGILLADDIYLGDMRNFWDTVPEPKFADETLHPGCGFGIAQKQ